MIRKLLASVSAVALTVAPISPAFAQSISRASNPLPVPCYPQATDASVRACLSKATAAGQTMVIYMPASPVTLTSSLPMPAGVEIVCVQPKVYDEAGGTSMVDEWGFVGGAGNGTVFTGNGTFAAFSTKKTALGVWDNAFVSAFKMRGCGFDNFTRAIDAGNTYSASFIHPVFENLYIHNVQDGFFLANMVMPTIHNIQVRKVSGSCGQVVSDVPNSLFEPGNYDFEKWFCAPNGSMITRQGWVFTATAGSTQGTINQRFLQIDAIGITTPAVEASVSITSGNSAIPVAHTENFPVGAIVQVGTATVGTGSNALTTGTWYAVLSRSAASGSGNLTLGKGRTFATISPNASGTISLTNGGYPLVEVTGGSGGAGTVASDFRGMDLETNNTSQAALYVERASGNAFQINGAFTSGVGVVLRNSLYPKVEVLQSNPTFDADNFAFFNGTIQSVVNKNPYGVVFNNSRSTQCLTLSGNTGNCDLELNFPGGVSLITASGTPLVGKLTAVGSSTFTATASHCNNVLGNSGTDNITLMAFQSTAGSNNLGCSPNYFNNQAAGTKLTLIANTGQLWNNGPSTNINLPSHTSVQLVGLSATVVQATAPISIGTTSTVANLPTCTTAMEGFPVMVSDANAPTWNATLTGGGSTHVMAVCENGNWTAH